MMPTLEYQRARVALWQRLIRSVRVGKRNRRKRREYRKELREAKADMVEFILENS